MPSVFSAPQPPAGTRPARAPKLQIVFTTLGKVTEALRSAVTGNPSTSRTVPAASPSTPRLKRTRSMASLPDPQEEPPATRSRIQPGDRCIPIALKMWKLKPNSNGHEATNDGAGGMEAVDYQELMDKGFELIEWDGEETVLIVDPLTDRIYTILVGRSTSPTHAQDCRELSELMIQLGQAPNVNDAELAHKRGFTFLALNAGMYCGNGPAEPYNRSNGKHNAKVEQLLNHPAARRLAEEQDNAFKKYQHTLYTHVRKYTVRLRKAYSSLRVNWKNSIFNAVAFNLGTNVQCFFHRDAKDLAYSFCAVHALGEYDHTKGGHLALKEPKLIIQFPPGSLILTLSAVFTHGNTPIQPGENRQSFTQYVTGANIRFAKNGFKTMSHLKMHEPERHAKITKTELHTWQRGVDMWSTPLELLD